MTKPVRLLLSNVPLAKTEEIKQFVESFGTPQKVEKILNPKNQQFEGYVSVVLQTKYDISETIEAMNITPFKDVTIKAEIKNDPPPKKAPLFYEDSNNPFPFTGFDIVTKSKSKKPTSGKELAKDAPSNAGRDSKDTGSRPDKPEKSDAKSNDSSRKDKDSNKPKPPPSKRDVSPPRKGRGRYRDSDSDYYDDLDRRDKDRGRPRSPPRRDRSPPYSRRDRSPPRRRSPSYRDYSPDRDRSPPRRPRSPPRRGRSPPRRDRARSPKK